MNNIFLIIVGIMTLLIGSIVISGIIQKRARAAAEKRQLASRFYQRASQALAMSELLRAIPINPEINIYLFKLTTESLKQVKSLWPNYVDINIEIEKAIAREQGYKPQKAKLIPFPVDEKALGSLIHRIRKLNNYLKLLVENACLAEHTYEKWNQVMFKATSRLEIEGTIRLAARAVESNHAGSARNYFEYVKNKIESYPLDLSYKQQQLLEVKNLSDDLESKQKQMMEEEGRNIDPQKSEDSNDIFQDKKKW